MNTANSNSEQNMQASQLQCLSCICYETLVRENENGLKLVASL